MAGADAPSLRAIVARHGPACSFFDRGAAPCMRELAHGTSLGGRPPPLPGRSGLPASASQLTSALALIELEGVARRIVILPPDADPAHLATVIAAAGIDAAVIDAGTAAHPSLDALLRVVGRPAIEPRAQELPAHNHTE